ncbi:hypothetical protein [Larkinella arboricola]|uniref:Uncharacterized protein n=1 Tax=Larkinella arboricola TaxID=643671 RepID=A0A327X1Z8_LARAB|nr:hypothetical protein [Larkinella arboricola]RAK00150.1 hypothetical protein LX87_01848 [Larkinella arboricola]
MYLIFVLTGFALVFFTLPFLFYRPAFGPGCPYCKHTHALERQPRPALMKVLFFYMPTRYYKCLYCLKRFVQFRLVTVH